MQYNQYEECSLIDCPLQQNRSTTTYENKIQKHSRHFKGYKTIVCKSLWNVKIPALSSYQCLIFICQFVAKMSKSLGKAYLGLVQVICQVLEGNNQVFL